MSTKRRQERGESSAVLAVDLTDAERAAWEARLGYDTDNLFAWGEAVMGRLFAQSGERLVALLEHALRVYPLVPESPDGGIPSADPEEEQAEFDEEGFRAVLSDLLQTSDLGTVRESLEQDGGDVRGNAALLATFLDSLPEHTQRVVAIAALFRKTGVCPNGYPVPEKTFAPKDDEVWGLLVAHRNVVLPAYAALGHFGCTHTSFADVAHALLTASAGIPDDRERAIVLGELLRVLAKNTIDQYEADKRSARR